MSNLKKSVKSKIVSYGPKELVNQMQQMKDIEVIPPVAFANKIQVIRTGTVSTKTSGKQKK